jgi:peptidoglycan/LPS O-acetylase OafA/YrhL
MTKHYLVQLDGLRFIAVTCVLFSHWITYPVFNILNSFIGLGGVDLFFVLSAFLITGILLESKNINMDTTADAFTLKQFYIRRFLRIFPLYYLVIAIGYLINIPTARQNIWWYLTYTVNVTFYYGIDCGHFTHLWSLGLEEQFYLIFPLIVLFIPNKFLSKTFIFLIVLSILTKLVSFLITNDFAKINALANDMLPGSFDCFGLGALLAYYWTFERDKLEKILKKRFFFFSSFVLYIILSVIQLYHKNYLFVYLFWQFSMSVFSFWVIGMASLRKFNGIFKSFIEYKVIKYFGKISYGIYIYHNFVPFVLFMVGMKYYSFTGAVFVYFILFFLVTIGLSMLSWHLYEKPLNKLKRYFEYTK